MTDAATALVALGSNVGRRAGHLRSALEALQALGAHDLKVSALYETQPVAMAPGARPVLNAVCRFETVELPVPLVRRLLAIEDASGRQRDAGPPADRTLDLDLLLLGDQLSDTSTAIVPHPRLHRRAFVLVPACDVAPELVHPRLGHSLAKLLSRLPASEVERVRCGKRAAALADFETQDQPQHDELQGENA